MIFSKRHAIGRRLDFWFAEHPEVKREGMNYIGALNALGYYVVTIEGNRQRCYHCGGTILDNEDWIISQIDGEIYHDMCYVPEEPKEFKEFYKDKYGYWPGLSGELYDDVIAKLADTLCEYVDLKMKDKELK